MKIQGSERSKVTLTTSDKTRINRITLCDENRRPARGKHWQFERAIFKDKDRRKEIA